MKNDTQSDVVYVLDDSGRLRPARLKRKPFMPWGRRQWEKQMARKREKLIARGRV